MSQSSSQQPTGVSPHVRALSQAMEALRLARGLSRRQLALAAGLHPTQMSQILLGRQGFSVERAADILAVLGASLIVAPVDERTPHRLGTLDGAGVAHLDGPLAFPGALACSAALHGLAAGESVHLRASDAFTPDALHLVTLGAHHEVRRAIVLDGMRFLRDAAGDDLRYVPERHTILAVAYAACRAL
jgi:transcriptional regulator with XRE-family HTH domain